MPAKKRKHSDQTDRPQAIRRAAFVIRTVIVTGDENKLKLGKGVAFVKSQLKRLRRKTKPGRPTFGRCPSRFLRAPRTTSAWSLLSQTAFFVPMQKSNDHPM